MLVTQSGKFQNFEFEILAGNSSNTWRIKIEQILITVSFTVLARSNPVAMLLDGATVDPSPLCPDPGREKWREGEERAQDPPRRLTSSCTSPTTLPSPAPTHSTPRPRRQPPSTPSRPPCPAWPLPTARAPAPASFWPPLPSTSRAYKTLPVEP
jgi:hypothetical protein